MKRLIVIAVGALFLGVPLVSAVSPVGVPDPGVLGPRDYIVGFYDTIPRGMEPGDDFHGGTVVKTDLGLMFAVVRTDNPLLFEASVRTDDRVRYIEWDDPAYAVVSLVPNDARYNDAGHWGSKKIGGEAAWDRTTGTTAVKVAMIDSGLNKGHEDIDRYTQGHDFHNGDSDPNDESGCSFHGTHTTGTAGATINNGLGIAGMSQHTIIPIKALGSSAFGCTGSTSGLASALRYAGDQGAHVSSNSWGGGGNSTTLNDAIVYAHNLGVTQIAAAGNSGPCTNCVSSPWKDKPGKVIIVASTTSSDGQSSFSSEGPEVDVAAPGSSILSTTSGTSGYSTLSGTSMATPHVAGTAALLIALDATWGYAEVHNALRDTAVDLGSTGKDDEFGYGRIDADGATALADGGGGDPPPPPPGESRISFEDFDDGAADGWTLSGLWHVSSACSTPPSTPNYVGYNEDSDCQYSTGSATSGTATFSVDTTDATVGTLNFDHRWETESYASGAFDIMRVQASTDGSSWTTLQQWDSRDSNQLSWGAHSLDVDSFVGGTLHVRFFFDTVDSVSNGFAGWFVDNVEVTADAGGGGDPPPNSPPTANAGPDQTVSDNDGSGAESVTLDGTGSSDSDGSITSYAWTEGGSTIATGATPTVSFGVGSHTVTLTVTDDDGATDSDTVVITVNANQAPTASFTSSCTDLTCSFDGTGSSDADGSISSYSWDFGDGNGASGATPSHTYAAGGTYTVTLTVTDNGGATDADSQSVTVTEPPTGGQVFFEDFDDGSAQGWTKNTGALWHLSTGCGTAHSGSYKLVWADASSCTYDVGDTGLQWAKTPAIDLAGFSTAEVSFWHWFETESYSGSAYDVLRVQYSCNDSSWSTLEQWDSRDPNVASWTEQTYDVSACAGGNLWIRYTGDTIDGSFNNFDGWRIDDVGVTAS